MAVTSRLKSVLCSCHKWPRSAPSDPSAAPLCQLAFFLSLLRTFLIYLKIKNKSNAPIVIYANQQIKPKGKLFIPLSSYYWQFAGWELRTQFFEKRAMHRWNIGKPMTMSRYQISRTERHYFLLPLSFIVFIQFANCTEAGLQPFN